MKKTKQNRREDLLTALEACEYLDMSRRVMSDRVASGRLVAVKDGSRKMMFLRSDLDAYIESCRTAKPSRIKVAPSTLRANAPARPLTKAEVNSRLGLESLAK